jgi:hypothetical protein
MNDKEELLIRLKLHLSVRMAEKNVSMANIDSKSNNSFDCVYRASLEGYKDALLDFYYYLEEIEDD